METKTTEELQTLLCEIVRSIRADQTLDRTLRPVAHKAMWELRRRGVTSYDFTSIYFPR